MTLPFCYQNASLQFEQFMVDARDLADLPSTNMAWNRVVGVLRTFRRRLTVEQALRFADVLPPVVRYQFVEDCGEMWMAMRWTGCWPPCQKVPASSGLVSPRHD